MRVAEGAGERESKSSFRSVVPGQTNLVQLVLCRETETERVTDQEFQTLT